MVKNRLFRFKRIKDRILHYIPVLFLLFSIFFMVLGVVDSPKIEPVRAFVIETSLPIVKVVRAPIFWIQNGVQFVKDWTKTYRENIQLKTENSELMAWRTVALQLQVENEELKQHLQYIPPKKTHTVMADILLNEDAAFSRSFLVNVGQNDGVIKGMLAFTSHGLFGRVVEVMDTYSTVMPLTDYQSRVPVWVSDYKLNAFLLGDNTNNPTVEFVEELTHPINEGDLVMTSGYMGVYPANIPLGVISQVDEGEIRVKLMENGHHNAFVRLIDYGLTKPLIKTEEK